MADFAGLSADLRSRWTKQSLPTAKEGDLVMARCKERLAHLTFSVIYAAAILRQCSQAAWIKFSLASGVRNAECADSVTLGNFVSG
jgi:hypothetical protein